MSQYANDINRILASLNGQEDEQDQPLPEEEDLDTIHVYPVEGGGLLLTRTPLEEEEAAPPVIDSQPYQTSTRAAPRSLPPFVLFLLVLGLFLMGDLADNQLIALLTPTVTIALTPAVHTVKLQSTASLGKLLSPITLSQSQTVPATGMAHQDASHAVGTVTFANGQQTVQTVPQGTVLTGSDGVSIVTTQSASIPAGNPSTGYGTVTVTAQAQHIGSRGNLGAGDINTTIALAVFVRNNPFHGGQDARDFLLVTQADRDQATTSLQAKVTASMSAALAGQLLPGQVLHPLPCPPAITADHAVGEEATTLTVTVSETCTAVAYNEQQLQSRATHLLTAQAMHAYGTGYLLSGNAQVSKAVVGPASPLVALTFTCAGTFAYTFTTRAQQHLKALLAGQPRLSALRWLRQQLGIQSASISGVSDNQLLPDDLSHLHLLIVERLW